MPVYLFETEGLYESLLKAFKGCCKDSEFRRRIHKHQYEGTCVLRLAVSPVVSCTCWLLVKVSEWSFFVVILLLVDLSKCFFLSLRAPCKSIQMVPPMCLKALCKMSQNGFDVFLPRSSITGDTVSLFGVSCKGLQVVHSLLCFWVPCNSMRSLHALGRPTKTSIWSLLCVWATYEGLPKSPPVFSAPCKNLPIAPLLFLGSCEGLRMVPPIFVGLPVRVSTRPLPRFGFLIKVSKWSIPSCCRREGRGLATTNN